MDPGSTTKSDQRSAPDGRDPWRLLGFDWTQNAAALGFWPGLQIVQQAFDYWIDAWQRSILFLDVMRQRGNNHLERAAEQVPNVLGFGFEMCIASGQFIDDTRGGNWACDKGRWGAF